MWMERFRTELRIPPGQRRVRETARLDFTYFNHTRTDDITSRMTSDTDAIRHALSWVSYQVRTVVVMFVGARHDVHHRLAVGVGARLCHRSSSSSRAAYRRTRIRCSSPSATPLAEMNSMVEENIEGSQWSRRSYAKP